MFSSEAWQQINTKIVGLLPGIFSGIVVFILFWIGAALLRGIVIRVGAVRGIDTDLTRFLGRATRVATLVFGTVTALGTAGVDVPASVGLQGAGTGFFVGLTNDVWYNFLFTNVLLFRAPITAGGRASWGNIPNATALLGFPIYAVTGTVDFAKVGTRPLQSFTDPIILQ